MHNQPLDAIQRLASGRSYINDEAHADRISLRARGIDHKIVDGDDVLTWTTEPARGGCGNQQYSQPTACACTMLGVSANVTVIHELLKNDRCTPHVRRRDAERRA